MKLAGNSRRRRWVPPRRYSTLLWPRILHIKLICYFRKTVDGRSCRSEKKRNIRRLNFVFFFFIKISFDVVHFERVFFSMLWKYDNFVFCGNCNARPHTNSLYRSFEYLRARAYTDIVPIYICRRRDIIAIIFYLEISASIIISNAFIFVGLLL